MKCSVCICNSKVLDLFLFCHSCGSSLKDRHISREFNLGSASNSRELNSTQMASDGAANAAIVGPSFPAAPQLPVHPLQLPRFEGFRKRGSAERTGGLKRKKPIQPNEVMINIGIMKNCDGTLSAVKGKTMSLRVTTTIRKVQLLTMGMDKHGGHDQNFNRFSDYTIVYPDGREILTIPGKPAESFQLDRYKEEGGKPYNRITLFLVGRNELEIVKQVLTMAANAKDSLEDAGNVLLNSKTSLDDAYASLIDEASSDIYASEHQYLERDGTYTDSSSSFSIDETMKKKLYALKASELKPDGYLRLKQKQYFLYGQLTGLGLLQGSPGPKYFQKSVVDYVLYRDIGRINPTIDEIPDMEVSQVLAALAKIEDENEFKKKASFKCDFRFDAGYSKALITIEDKEDFLKCISLHYTVLSAIYELNQFIEGLKSFNIYGAVCECPEIFRKVFQTSSGLTAEVVDSVFQSIFSPKGSNRCPVEEQIVFNFNQYLEDVEKGAVKQWSATVGDELQMKTGLSAIIADVGVPQSATNYNKGKPGLNPFTVS
eukprot:gene12404-13689_t